MGLKPTQKTEKVKDEEEKNDKEETYCFCSQVFITHITIRAKHIATVRCDFNFQVSYGLMIGCDNAKCEIGWFHFR